MTSSVNEFQPAIKADWAWIVTSDKKGNPGKNYKAAASLASRIYHNTVDADLPFILLGRDQIRTIPDLAANFGLCTTRTQGSILGERQWSLLINDAFILGGIHSRKDVLVMMNKDFKRNMLWNDKSCSLTSFGRELAILQFAGFQRISTFSQTEVIFHLHESAPDPKDITLPEIWAHLKQIRSPDSLLAFVNEYCCERSGPEPIIERT
jgi:hypothetical protein